jgi:peptide deformylase
LGTGVKMSTVLTFNTEEDIVKEEEILPLTLYDDNHPMLSRVVPEYDIRNLPNPNIIKTVKRLKMTMKLHNGMGLSANQCGLFERVFVIGTEHFQLVCINPKIVEQSEEMIKDAEGCLSFPGMSLKVKRSDWIIAEYYDENGKIHNVKMEGLTARCYQHELDHMNGIKFTSYAGPVMLQLAKQKQQKLIKKIKRLSR